jgi:hypothetical protein
MRIFDEKWQHAAERARQAPRRDETAPFGFAARVDAAVRQSPAPGLEMLWVRLTLRSLAGVCVVLLVCAALELPHFSDTRPLDPGIDNTVIQLIWAL